MSDNKNGNGYGFTDEKATEDRFGIADYIGGLARFIEKCDTPMTISIQGTWGTGKTSIMNLVEKELSGDVKTIWFNTWRFSQFNMENQLAVSLLSSLISEFKIQDEKTRKDANKLVNGLKAIAGVGQDLAIGFLEQKFGSRIANRAENAQQKIQETYIKKDKVSEDTDNNNYEYENSYIEPTEAIEKLQEQFGECVKKTLEEQNKKRIVIFIDDLDRLEPRKAVELLEVLKLFLDCKGCVFVLAIDYDVVCRGVAAKYGELADDKLEASEKGKSFFDKIIQVPFKMPVARYNITGYVQDCFNKIGMTFSESELKNYVDLIKTSIGTNPRSMKRLFNSYQLLVFVVPEGLLSEQKNQQLLFAVLCLQYCNEKIYNFIIRNSGNLNIEMLNTIFDCEFNDFIKIVDDTEDVTGDDFASARPFMEKFKKVVDLDGNGTIDECELSNFKQVLRFTEVTSNSDTEPVTRRGSQIVNSYDELDMGTFTPNDMQRVVGEIKSFGDDVTIQLVKSKNYSHITARIGGENGPLFADIYERKNGCNIDCFVPRAEVYTNGEKYPEIVKWIDNSKYKPGKAAGGKRLSPAAYNDEDEKNMLNLVRLVYNVWKNE
jgi:hypothetical protein